MGAAETSDRRKGRRGAVWAWAAAALTAVATAAGIVLHGLDRGSGAAIGVTDWWLMQALCGVAFTATGAWLARARPALPIGWLMLAVGVLGAVSLAGVEYGVWALGRPGGAPLASVAFWFANWTWLTGLLVVGTVLPLLLPDGRLMSPRWRVALGLSVVAVVAQSLAWMLTPYESWSPALRSAGAVNPTGASWVLAGAVQVPLTVVTLAAAVVALAGLAVRWHRSAGVERQQLKWILYGLVLAVALFAAGFALGPVVTALAMLPLPAACLVAALRYRLWDVEFVVSRSLLFAALSAAVVAVYVACVGLLGGLLGRTTGAPLLATAVVAVCAEPLHRRLRGLVNRLVYGERDDPFTVLARVGQRLEHARDGATVAEQVLPEVVASVASALRLAYVAVALADGSVVEHGRRTGPVREIGLGYAGRQVGRLLFTPRAGEPAGADRRLLDDLARHAAVAAHTVMLTHELARSREQLLTAREEERRRLYRELHDGLGPSLAALALQVETAQEIAPIDPQAASTLLARATPRLKATVDDVRTIVRGLRPSTLDDLGLAGALRELARRFETPDFDVSVRFDGPSALPAVVEVAAYRVTAEALTNAARHSGAASVAIEVEQRDGLLSVAVRDDGRGWPQDPSGAGVGMSSMRERTRELGGMFTVRRAQPGPGTHVEALFPLGIR